MTLWSRVATFAAMSFSLAGLVATSTPGRAAELARPAAQVWTAIQVPALGMVNIPTPALIPAAPLLDAPAEDDFDTLAEAVAAHESAAADEATRCLAGAVYFEAKGEPLHGQLAVAQVVLNRAKSGRFPPDVCGVVTQRGQFGFVRGGRIPSIDEGRASWRTAVAVARVALAEAWDSAAPTALYFNTPGRAPGARLQRVAAIGNHVFWR